MLDLKKMLCDMVAPIVDDPSAISIIESETEPGNILLELSVAPDDMGKVIGKHGRIAKAIRAVIKAVANAEGRRVTVDIK